jgi:hypothetical protein
MLDYTIHLTSFLINGIATEYFVLTGSYPPVCRQDMQ